MDIIARSVEILNDAAFTVRTAEIGSRPALLFENETVLGFLFAYLTTTDLLALWKDDANTAVASNQFSLRIASQKAWNTYVIFLSEDSPNAVGLTMLAAIEEDLSGTRKIARAGVTDSAALSDALLTLLPLQAAPHLGVAS